MIRPSTQDYSEFCRTTVVGMPNKEALFNAVRFWSDWDSRAGIPDQSLSDPAQDNTEQNQFRILPRLLYIVRSMFNKEALFNAVRSWSDWDSRAGIPD